MFKNQLLEHPPSGRKVRILDLDPTTQTVWLFDMSDHVALPRPFDVNDVKTALDSKEFVEIAASSPPEVRKPSAAAIARRDQAYACIEPLIQNFEIFCARTRAALIAGRADELECSPQTIYKHLRSWWRNGQTRHALLPNFHKSGSTEGKTSGRGRPPVFEDRPIYQITDSDQPAMQSALDLYLKSEVVSLAAAYQRLLEWHYSYQDAEGVMRISAPGEHPTEVQFRRYISKHVTFEMRIRSRKGDAEFELKNRPKLGSLRHITYTIGEYYETDATIADVPIVHSEDRSKIIGKAVIYMIWDRKSGLCVGFYVGLENPSWLAAMHAIKSITEDKAALCARYSVHYDPNDWPADCIFPKTFVGDRGPEMVSTASTQLAEGLACTVLNLPARRADWKPHVECGFKQSRQVLADRVPGYVPPENFGKRQQHDFGKDAALTLDEFTRVVLIAVIKKNRTPIENYRLEPKYMLSGMQPTPINIWNTEIRERAGLLNRYTEPQVRFALLPRAQAVVTREGIRLGSCFYSAPEALAKHWFVTAGRGSFTVTVSYDRRLADAIYVHDEQEPDGYFVAQLLDKCSHFRGKNFSEIESLEHYRTALTLEGQHIKRQLRSEFHAAIDPMVDEATKKTKAASQGKSRSARKKDVVEARKDELTRQRQHEARITAEAPLEKPADVIPLRDLQKPADAPNSAQKSRQQQYQDLLNGN